MNDLILETDLNGCYVGKIDGSMSNQMTANVKTIVTFPSSMNKIISGCMKMLGHGVIASSNLFLLDSCQDLVDIDSKFLMNVTIIRIPRKHTNYWTIQWENNFVMTKFRRRIFGYK